MKELHKILEGVPGPYLPTTYELANLAAILRGNVHSNKEAVELAMNIWYECYRVIKRRKEMEVPK